MNHPSTPPFIARSFIQHLVLSNPSPCYVQSVATAFKQGVFSQFGSGKRGDMTATVDAVLMDREVKSSTLDLDLSHGEMREPLIKLIHSLRGLELKYKPGLEDIRVDDRLSQQPYRAPTVFNYFHYDHRPSTIRTYGTNRASCPRSPTVGRTRGFELHELPQHNCRSWVN